jgi:hypothetical protein
MMTSAAMEKKNGTDKPWSHRSLHTNRVKIARMELGPRHPPHILQGIILKTKSISQFPNTP